MERSSLPWSWSLFGLLITVALGFGVANAGPSAIEECLDAPPDFLGECLSGTPGDVACQTKCEFHQGWKGICYQDNPAPAPRCCVCIL